jgi:hypothetical protein
VVVTDPPEISPFLSRFDVCCILRRAASESSSLQSSMNSKTSAPRLILLTISELTSCPSDRMSCSAIVVFSASNLCSFSDTTKSSCSSILLFLHGFFLNILKCSHTRTVHATWLGLELQRHIPKVREGVLYFLCLTSRHDPRVSTIALASPSYRSERGVVVHIACKTNGRIVQKAEFPSSYTRAPITGK